MEDFITDILWFGFFCCLLPLVIGGPIGFVLYRNKQRREGSQAIAQALGLQPTVKAKQMQWYEGQLADGRLCAYIPIIFQRHYNDHEGRRRRTHRSAARLVVEVKRERPLSLNIFRHEKWTKRKNSLDSFDTAFTVKNGETLTSSQQAALLTFARQNPGTLWLDDREGASTDVFNSPEVMAGATSFLLHEYQVVNPTPAEIQAKTAELSQLAKLFDA